MNEVNPRLGATYEETCTGWLRERFRKTVDGVVQAFGAARRADWPAPPVVEALEQLVRQGDIDAAERLCRAADAARGGAPAFGLVLEVIHRIETDWLDAPGADGPLTFAFWNVQTLLDRLRDPAETMKPGDGGAVLIALPEEERHQFGARIVAQELQRRGWDTISDLSSSRRGVLERVETTWFEAVGLSAGHDGAFVGLADFIAELRSVSRNPGLEVILGGAAIDSAPSHYAFLGADCVAVDLRQAMDFLNGMRQRRRRQDWN